MYKRLCKIQQDNCIDPEFSKESFEKLATDPKEIVKLNLEFAIMASDKFQLENGFTKEQVMVAFYGTGLDKDESIASFHKQMRKQMQHMLFNLGDALETRLKEELRNLEEKKEINVDLTARPVVSFEDYCAIGSIAVKYSTLRILNEEKLWETQRRKLIRRKKGAEGEKNWIETEISNEYA